MFCTFSLANVLRAFVHFTCKCASRYSGVQCFDIRTSKSVPTSSTCFCTFSLPNLFFATAACIFSTSELQKSAPGPSVFNICTSKCASRHSDVQFFDVRTAKSAPRTEDRSFLTFHFKMCFSHSDVQFLIPLTT